MDAKVCLFHHRGLGYVGDGDDRRSSFLRFTQRGQSVGRFAGLRDDYSEGFAGNLVGGELELAGVINVHRNTGQRLDHELACDACVATCAGSSDHDPTETLKIRLLPRALVQREIWGVHLRGLEGPQHCGRLLEDLAQHVVLEFGHQSSSVVAAAVSCSQSHNAAEPAMPASAPYLAGKIGISFARELMLHCGSDLLICSNHPGILEPSPPPITMTSGSSRSTTFPNQIVRRSMVSCITLSASGSLACQAFTTTSALMALTLPPASLSIAAPLAPLPETCSCARSAIAGPDAILSKQPRFPHPQRTGARKSMVMCPPSAAVPVRPYKTRPSKIIAVPTPVPMVP